MIIFQSMVQVSLYIAFTIFFLLLFVLRGNPLLAFRYCVGKALTSQKYALHLMAVIAIIFFNKIELWFEQQMADRNDFTPVLYKLEGNLVAYVQKLFENEVLTFVSTYFYVVMFPSLIIASLLIYSYQKKQRFFYAMCYALIINYLVAIPFYLFFPVNEVWFYNSEIRFLIPDVFPTFEKDYRPLSGLNNSFPSLHTSISVSLAYIAVKSGHPWWGRWVVFSAGAVIFSIFYLGIHWFTDMIGGILLGLFAANLGILFSKEKVMVSNKTAIPVNEKWWKNDYTRTK